MDDGDVTHDKPRGKYPWLWLGWLILLVGGFFAIEVPALVNSTGGDTFTEQVQYVAGYSWFALAMVSGGLVALFTWLIPHFFGPSSRVWLWIKLRREQKNAKG